MRNKYDHVCSALLDTIASKTLERIKKDKADLVEQIQQCLDLNTTQAAQVLEPNHAMQEKLPEDLRTRIFNVNQIAEQAHNALLTAKDNLALLWVKACVMFDNTPEDALTAWIKCLPAYFHAENVLNTIVNKDGVRVLDDDIIQKITVHSYVHDSAFVRFQQVKPQVAEALNFFVGTQLINDLF